MYHVLSGWVLRVGDPDLSGNKEFVLPNFPTKVGFPERFSPTKVGSPDLWNYYT